MKELEEKNLEMFIKRKSKNGIKDITVKIGTDL